ncbi:hypothetical protein ACFV4Q_20050 [Streptomyces nojiriensis]|uniref:hypothetical protein n=1 Tax=Streptomyces nojiriensis TaxID=66374 RepID=UPI00366359E1
MGGMQDKRQEPGKGREEQQRPQRPQQPGQDPVHPEPGTPSRGGKSPDEDKRRRQEDLIRDERDDQRGDETF